MYTGIFLIFNTWFHVPLNIYTQFRYVCIFHLYLFPSCRTTLLYVKNVPQYHWQIHNYNIIFRNCAHPILILWAHFKPYENQLIFSEMEQYLQQQEWVNFYPTRVGIYILWKMNYLIRECNNHEIKAIFLKIKVKVCSMTKLQ
jgi:hypothetical protein